MAELSPLDEAETLRFLEERDNVSDEALIARMNAAPDKGGALLVELSEFVERRADVKKPPG